MGRDLRPDERGDASQPAGRGAAGASGAAFRGTALGGLPRNACALWMLGQAAEGAAILSRVTTGVTLFPMVLGFGHFRGLAS